MNELGPKIDINKILQENPEAKVSDFKDGKYAPKKKIVLEKSPEEKAEESRIVTELKKDLEKEIRDRQKFLGMTFETSPGMTTMRNSLENLKTEKIDTLRRLIQNFEVENIKKEAVASEDETIKKLHAEIAVINILSEAKAIDLPDSRQKVEFEKIITKLENSILDYNDYKKQKNDLEKLFEKGKLILDKNLDPKIPNKDGKKKTPDQILVEIKNLEDNMLIEQENKLQWVVDLKLMIDSENNAWN